MKVIFYIYIILFITGSLRAQYKCSELDIHGKPKHFSSPVLKAYGVYKSSPELDDSLPESEVVKAKEFIKRLDFQDQVNKNIFCIKKTKENIFPLFDVIMQGLVTGKIMAFKENSYNPVVSVKLSCAEVLTKLIHTDSVENYFINADGVEVHEKKLQTDTLKPENISGIYFNEVWYFNKKWSRLEKRIIGIAPVWRNPKTNKEETLFWIYYNESREWLSAYAANTQTSVGNKKSYEEIFYSRFYNGTIIKESNVYNRTLAEEFKGIDLLLENEKAKENVLKKEEDFWEK